MKAIWLLLPHQVSLVTPKMKQEAFTVTGEGYINRIIVPVQVISTTGKSGMFPALIDTGATNTCISSEVAESLELVSVGTVENHTANGKATVNTYVVDLALCNGRVHIQKNRVIEVNLKEQSGVEMLIGMDVLRHGDFIITNQNGVTKASFRVPSVLSTDFIPEVERNNKMEDEKQKRIDNQAKRGGKKKRKKR